MKRSVGGPLPPTLVQSLERWEQFGLQAGIDKAVLLKVASPEILAALQKSPRRPLPGRNPQPGDRGGQTRRRRPHPPRPRRPGLFDRLQTRSIILIVTA